MFSLVLPVLLVMVLCGLMGFLDDFIKISTGTSMGLLPYQKVLLAAAGVTARILMCTPDRMAARAQTPLEQIFVYGNAAYAVMLLKKRKPRPGETPLAFARRMDRQKAFPAPVSPLWRLMALSNYRPSQPGPEQAAQARSVFRQLYQKQRMITKLRFVLWSAFGKGCYTCLDTQLVHEQPPASLSLVEHIRSKNAQKGRKKTSPTAGAYKRSESNREES